MKKNNQIYNNKLFAYNPNLDKDSVDAWKDNYKEQLQKISLSNYRSASSLYKDYRKWALSNNTNVVNEHTFHKKVAHISYVLKTPKLEYLYTGFEIN